MSLTAGPPGGLLLDAIKPVESFIVAVHRQRLKSAGKPSKLALIAIANKLLRQAFTLVRFGRGL